MSILNAITEAFKSEDRKSWERYVALLSAGNPKDVPELQKVMQYLGLFPQDAQEHLKAISIFREHERNVKEGLAAEAPALEAKARWEAERDKAQQIIEELHTKVRQLFAEKQTLEFKASRIDYFTNELRAIKSKHPELLRNFEIPVRPKVPFNPTPAPPPLPPADPHPGATDLRVLQEVSVNSFKQAAEAEKQRQEAEKPKGKVLGWGKKPGDEIAG